jgi:hypothetical protein
MTMPDRRTTPRGFGIYAKLTDSHASIVRVQQSSAADAPHVWIFADHADQGRASLERFLARFGGRLDGIDLNELAAFLTPSPHLTVDQAKRVRDALDEFIREHEMRENGDHA